MKKLNKSIGNTKKIRNVFRGKSRKWEKNGMNGIGSKTRMRRKKTVTKHTQALSLRFYGFYFSDDLL